MPQKCINADAHSEGIAAFPLVVGLQNSVYL